jgi:tRNA pseudouridine55 synthase
MARQAKNAAKDLVGMLVVNKPSKITSKDVSRWLEKRLGKLQIGHVGTLDPLAEGVLPILLGRATRLQDFLLRSEKVYEFDVKFGVETDTLDSEGSEIETSCFAHIQEEAIVSLCRQMVGQIEQTTPLYSAVKFKGKPLYKYARNGNADEVPVERLRRLITIKELNLLNYQSDSGIATFQVSCSEGTYVRSLAKDIANRLGTCGHITRLVRLATCGIAVKEAFSLDDCEKNIDNLMELMVPMEQLKTDLPTLHLSNDDLIKKVFFGQDVILNRNAEGYESLRSEASERNLSPSFALLSNNSGKLIAILSLEPLSPMQMRVRMKRSLI